MGTAAEKKKLTGMSSRNAAKRLKEILATDFPELKFNRANKSFAATNGISLLAIAEMWHNLRSRNKTVELMIQSFAESVSRRNEKIHALDLVIVKQRDALAKLQAAYNGLKTEVRQAKAPHKRPFVTRADCEKSINDNDIGVKLYAYRCRICDFWHKTSQLGPDVPTNSTGLDSGRNPVLTSSGDAS